jgi:hypothetical protein
MVIVRWAFMLKDNASNGPTRKSIFFIILVLFFVFRFNGRGGSHGIDNPDGTSWRSTSCH